MQRFLWFVIFIILIIAGVFVYWRFYRPYEEGNRSGTLVNLVKTGAIFKTYEGALITGEVDTSKQQKRLIFSVADPALGDSLMLLQGHQIVIHYSRYIGTLPWRGNSHYIVTKLLYDAGAP